tara:strand:- start:1138 stop:1545 length:408 start_codon:yes stop_codon:yes gene_type:complete
MQMASEEKPKLTPLTDSVKSSTYKELSQNECIVLGMLDSCRPGPDAVSWFCSWEHLVKLASVAPSIADDRLMAIVGTLTHLKIIDTCVGSLNGEPGFYVSRWQHRARLRHDFMQHVLDERRAMVDRVAEQTTTAA